MVVTARVGCCCTGTKFAYFSDNNTNGNKAKESVFRVLRGIICHKITYCKNAVEFVEAVKQQIATLVRECSGHYQRTFIIIIVV